MTYTDASITELVFVFNVAKDYQANRDETTAKNMSDLLDTVKKNANDVVTTHFNKSPYDKLTVYKEYICGAVSYNDDATKTS